jgi:YidC/Oxa1 family membrane protein insertase
LKNDLSLVMDFGFFGMIAEGLLLGMNGLNHIGLSYGWAIVAITIMIKLVFWPLTAASSRSMKRMAALQPQMKELQAKYKDEPQKLQVKMMEFWKEHKVNPFGGCLPLLLQMPIFFGFFYNASQRCGTAWSFFPLGLRSFKGGYSGIYPRIELSN